MTCDLGYIVSFVEISNSFRNYNVAGIFITEPIGIFGYFDFGVGDDVVIDAVDFEVIGEGCGSA